MRWWWLSVSGNFSDPHASSEFQSAPRDERGDIQHQLACFGRFPKRFCWCSWRSRRLIDVDDLLGYYCCRCFNCDNFQRFARWSWRGVKLPRITRRCCFSYVILWMERKERTKTRNQMPKHAVERCRKWSCNDGNYYLTNKNRQKGCPLRKNFSNFTRLELCVARMQFLPRIGRLTMLFFVLMAFLTALFVLWWACYCYPFNCPRNWSPSMVVWIPTALLAVLIWRFLTLRFFHDSESPTSYSS